MGAETLFVQIKAVDQFTGTFRRLQTEASGASTKVGMLGKVAGAVAVGGVFALAYGLGKCVEAAMESQKVQAVTTAHIESTGSAAKVTADHVFKLASEIQNYSGMSDEAVLSGANMLLTFTNIRNEVGEGNNIFDRATKAMADLSASGFGDLESSAKMLGKALNDPIAGMNAMSRAGVTFSQSQKDMIKSLVESGNVLEAQKLILAEVERQVGGTAAAIGDTLPGKIEILKNKFNDMMEQVGMALIPVLTDLVDWLNRQDWEAIGQKIARAIEILKNLPATIKTAWLEVEQVFLNAARTLGQSIYRLMDVLEHVPGPMGKWATTAKQALGATVDEINAESAKLQYQQDQMTGKVEEANAKMTESWTKLGKDGQQKFGDLMKTLATQVMTGNRSLASKTADGMKGMMNSIVAGMPGVEGKQKQLVSKLIEAIKTPNFYSASSQKIMEMAAGISATTGVPVSTIVACMNQLRGQVEGADMSGPGVGLMNRLAAAIDAGDEAVIAEVQGLMAAVSAVVNATQLVLRIAVSMGNLPGALGSNEDEDHRGGAVRAHQGMLMTDERPSILQAGEYVVSRKAARRVGLRTLNAINRGQTTGGTVVNFNSTFSMASDSEMRRAARKLSQYLAAEGAR